MSTKGWTEDDNIGFADRWRKMKPVIGCLINQKDVTKEEWHTLFWDAFKAVLWDEEGCVHLYEALQELIQEQLSEVVARIPDTEDGLTLLAKYHQEWIVYRDQIQYIPGPFRPLEEDMLNRSDVSEQLDEDEVSVGITNLLLLEWYAVLGEYQDKLCTAALDLVKQEREGHVNNHSEYVVSLKDSFAELSNVLQTNIYKTEWAAKYTASTEKFYKNRADGVLLESNDTQSYMRFAHRALKGEEERSRKYLLSESRDKLMEILTQVLVVNNAELIRLELSQMMAVYDTESLKLMFYLLNRVDNGVEPILKELENHILSRGKLGLKNTNLNDGESLVTFMINFMKKQKSLIEDAFDNDVRFTTARDKAFVALLNDMTIFEKESKCPEVIANHIDGLLRKKALSKKYSADEIAERLTNILLILKYVSAKDIFMRHYKLHLTRRLVLNMWINFEEEMRYTDYLCHIGMPSDAINKLTRMFQDIQTSDDLNKTLRTELENDIINVKILSAGAWVKGVSNFPIQLPHEVEDNISKIVEHYNKIHSGRKLNFHPLLSHGSLLFKSKLGKYELEVTAMQVAVLSSWNRRPNSQLKISDLLVSTMLPEVELRKTLISLSQNPKLKIQIILAEPKIKNQRDFPDTVQFRINRGFALIKGGKVAPRGKVSLIGRLPLVAERPNSDDQQEIEQVRGMRTQEAIIKIMKSRKKSTLANLTSELVEVLRAQFLPPKKIIKEQLEWLIERDFIQRDGANSETFIYKA